MNGRKAKELRKQTKYNPKAPRMSATTTVGTTVMVGSEGKYEYKRLKKEQRKSK